MDETAAHPVEPQINLRHVVEDIAAFCEQKGLKIALAESLTGGLLADAFVSVAGSSRYFLGSIVAYQTQLKHSLLGVPSDLLDSVGAVDSQVAAQMARGVRERFASDLSLPSENVIGLSTTGVAGPTAQDAQPVGRVYIALSMSGSALDPEVFQFDFVGDRQSIRKQAVSNALVKLREQFLS